MRHARGLAAPGRRLRRARAAGLTGPQTDELNRAVLAELQLGGSVFVTGTTVGGAFALRACIVNPGTSPDDVAGAGELISTTATRLLPPDAGSSRRS
jgi:aromatic-L-amino-acid decarboxylase